MVEFVNVQVPKVKSGAAFKFDHKLCAMELVASTVCVTCVLKEGNCRSHCSGNYEESFKKCWWFSQAVKKVSGVLDAYDK